MSDQAVRSGLGLRLMAIAIRPHGQTEEGARAQGVGATLMRRRKGTQTLETRQLLNCGRCNSTGRSAASPPFFCRCPGTKPNSAAG